MKNPTIQTNGRRVLRASSPALVACFFMALSAKATLPTSDLPDFDSLFNFAGVGSQLKLNSATVNGDVGVFSGGALTFTKPAKDDIFGDVLLGTNATLSRQVTISGNLLRNQDLSSEQSSVFSDSTALGKLTPDQTFKKNRTKALSFDVDPGQVEVVNLNGGLNLKNQNINMTGGGDLVLNIKGTFTLKGSASILGNPDDIFINYLGTSAIATHSNDTINALVFDPKASANLAGTWSGGFFAGKKTVTLMPGATLTQAPEPGYIVLISTALASLLWARFLKRKSN